MDHGQRTYSCPRSQPPVGGEDLVEVLGDLDFVVVEVGEPGAIESAGFRDDGWLDVDGSYFGTTTKITERLRRVDYGRLELDVTVEDAKAYTRPWTVRVNYRLIPDQQLIEFVCNENEQSSKHYVKP